MKKDYQVFYIIKKNRKEYLEHMFVCAYNQKEAIQKCKELVYIRIGRNAFRATCKKPHEVRTKNGDTILTI